MDQFFLLNSYYKMLNVLTCNLLIQIHSYTIYVENLPYLCIFKNLMKKYDVVTFQKWMFLFGSIMILPLSFHSVSVLSWNTITVKTWLETAFVVVAATYFAYIFNMIGQRILRPTVISMYNYVQPIAACVVSVMAGLAIFGWKQSVAIFFVFIGVYLVTKSKSHHDLEKEVEKMN